MTVFSLGARWPKASYLIYVVGLSAQLCSICSSHFESVLFKAAFSLAFLGAFRSSEFLANSRSDPGDRMLALADVNIKGSELHVCL